MNCFCCLVWFYVSLREYTTSGFESGFVLLLPILLAMIAMSYTDVIHFNAYGWEFPKDAAVFGRCFPGFKNFQEGISESVSLHELIFWSHPRASKQPKGKTTGETEATDSEEAAQPQMWCWYKKCWVKPGGNVGGFCSNWSKFSREKIDWMLKLSDIQWCFFLVKGCGMKCPDAVFFRQMLCWKFLWHVERFDQAKQMGFVSDDRWQVGIDEE